MRKQLTFVRPLAVDSFTVAALIGAAGVSRARRWQIAGLFTAFEGGMPLIGLALGAPLAHALGSTADEVAAVALIVLGTWMLLFSDEDKEEEAAERLLDARGLAMIGLGLSISLDELAIGFSVGLARLPVNEVVVAIAVQAFLAAQLGMALGARVGGRWRENAERVAALALVALGIFLLVDRVIN